MTQIASSEGEVGRVATEPEEGLRLIALLERLLPQTEASRIAAAVEGLPAELPLERRVQLAAERLGLSFCEVRASVEELVAARVPLPALDTDPPSRLLLGVKRGSATLQLPGATPESVPLRTLGAEKKRFWILDRAYHLQWIAHHQGVRRLLSYLSSESQVVRLVVLFALGVEALSLAGPLTVQVLINTIAFGTLVQPLLLLSGVLFLCLSGAAALRLLQTYAVEHLARRFVEQVAMDLGRRLPRLSEQGAVPPFPAHRFFEVASVEKALFVLGIDFVALILQIVAATILLSIYHPLLLGFAGALVGAAWLCIRLPFGAALDRSYQESSAKYALAAWLSAEPDSEALTGRRLLASWLEARSRGFRVAFGQQALLLLVQILFSAGLLAIGGRLVIDGSLTLGQLVAAELVTTAALLSLGKVGKQLPKLYDLITSLEKLGRIVDLPLGPEPGRADGVEEAA